MKLKYYIFALQVLYLSFKKNAPCFSQNKFSEWVGTWYRYDKWENASLHISALSDSLSHFSIHATSGAQNDHIDGLILQSGSKAFYANASINQICKLHFELHGDSVITIQNDPKSNCGKTDVSFCGKYFRKKKNNFLIQYSLLDLGYFLNNEQDSLFRNDVKEFYELFVDASQILTQNFNDVYITKGKVRGLEKEKACIVVQSAYNPEYWAAVVDNKRILYFTNHHDNKRELPRFIKDWGSNFKNYKVVFMNTN